MIKYASKVGAFDATFETDEVQLIRALPGQHLKKKIDRVLVRAFARSIFAWSNILVMSLYKYWSNVRFTSAIARIRTLFISH